MRNYTVLMMTVFSCSLILCASCSSKTDAPVEGLALSPEIQALPALPSGPGEERQSNIVDNDLQQGHQAIESLRGTVGPANIVLEAGTAPGEEMAYAMFRHSARPAPDVPYTLTIDAEYLDPDPVVERPGEGYYVGYGDYASGRWVLSGPVRTGQARITFPAGADVVSPMDYIYSIVMAYQGNRVDVASINIGYDIGPGYEQAIVTPPSGIAAGGNSQIQIGSDGYPQIVYRAAGTLMGDIGGEIRIAQHNGTEWQIKTVDPGYNASFYAFALGDGGRRALVIENRELNELHLLYDDGGGSFSDDQLVSATYNSELMPNVTFVNGADDALGDLDTCLVVFGKQAAWPNVEKRSFEYDGTNPPVELNIGGGVSRLFSYYGLITRNDNTALASLPSAPAYPQLDCIFGSYSALADAWGPAGIDQLLDIDVEEDEGEFGVAITELPDNSIVAGYYTYDDTATVLLHWNGVAWNTTATDRKSCFRHKNPLDLCAFSDGSIGFPTLYGSFAQSFITGTVGSGVPMTQEYLSTEPFSTWTSSVAVDAGDVAHIASNDAFRGSLNYYRREPGGAVSVEEVDTGGGERGMSYGLAPIVVVDDELHVFYNDTAHWQVLHSVNVGGVWVEDAQPIGGPDCHCYIIFDAGYLEDLDLLWVAYMDIMSGSARIITGTPGLNDWYNEVFVPFAPEMFVVEDDGTNLGVVYYQLGLLLDDSLNFAFGPPRTSQAPAVEIVSLEEDLFDFPWVLSHNPYDNTWDLGTQDDNDNRCYYYHRPAAGAWQGPNLVLDEPGPAARVEILGITHQLSDGTTYLVTQREPDGSDVFSIEILIGDSATGTFATVLPLLDVDTTVYDYEYFKVEPDNTGRPYVGVMRRPTADTYWDIEVYQHDGIGAWTNSLTWDNPVAAAPEWFSHSQAMYSTGDVALSCVEMDGDEPDVGSVFLYYPW